MAISEEARHELYQALERSIGREQATTLMEHLPPVGWADVATRRDLEVLESRLQGRLDRELGQVWQEFGRVHADIAGWGRTIVLTNVASVMAAVGFAFAAARL